MSVCVTWHNKVHYQEQIQLVVGRVGGMWLEAEPLDYMTSALNNSTRPPSSMLFSFLSVFDPSTTSPVHILALRRKAKLYHYAMVVVFSGMSIVECCSPVLPK